MLGMLVCLLGGKCVWLVAMLLMLQGKPNGEEDPSDLSVLLQLADMVEEADSMEAAIAEAKKHRLFMSM